MRNLLIVATLSIAVAAVIKRVTEKKVTYAFGTPSSRFQEL